MRIPRDASTGATNAQERSGNTTSATNAADRRVRDTVGVQFDVLLRSAELGKAWRAIRPVFPEGSQPATWLKSVGEPVVRRAAPHLPKGVDPKLHVTPDPAPKLVSLPNGELFVSSGRLVESASTSDVRAAVAGELAHVALGHSTRRMIETVGPELMQSLNSGDDPEAAVKAARRLDAGPLAPYAATEQKAATELARSWLDAVGDVADDEAAFEAARRALLAGASPALNMPITALPDGRSLLLFVGGLVLVVAIARQCTD